MKKRTLQYADTLKADEVEEWIARIFLQPVAFRIVTLLLNTKIHPVHVTLCFFLTGIGAALLIYTGTYPALVIAAVMIQIKSILDAVDGQLARARKAPSRVGRFFDSAADIVISFLLIMACAFLTYERTGELIYLPIGIAAFLFSEIQNSFWVYYNVYYRNLKLGKDESILDESQAETIYPYDENKQRILSFLKGFYRFAYTWQDRLISRIDAKARMAAGIAEDDKKLWYSDIQFLKGSGLLGLGTNLFALSISLVLDNSLYYFVFVLFVANVYMVGLMLYRVRSFPVAGKNRDIS